jgi:cyclic beta-1,2-glucan synthetase
MKVDLVVLNTQRPATCRSCTTASWEAMFAANDTGDGGPPGGVFVRKRTSSARTRCSCCAPRRALHVACDGRSLGSHRRRHRAAVAEPARRHRGRPPPPEPPVRRGPPTGRRGGPIAPATAPGRAARARTGRPDAEPPVPPRAAAASTTGSAADAGGRLPDPRPRRPRAARALVERRRQPARRVRGQRARRGFTWAENSYFYRLTPWHNDPVSDPAVRGALPARRGDGSCGAPRPRRWAGRRLHRAPRRRALVVRVRARRHRHPLTLGMAEARR